MGARSSIGWTGSTWNLGRGCRHKDSGCLNCYAERQAIRGAYPGGPYDGLVANTGHGPRWTGKVTFDADALGDPVSWQEPRFVFVDSMSDLFYSPFTDEQIAACIGGMMLAPEHVYQVLTKREVRAVSFFEDVTPTGCLAAARCMGLQLSPRQAARTFARLPDAHPLRPLFRPGGVASCELPFKSEHHADLRAVTWPLPHLWLGASVNDQASFDERVASVRRFNAVVRFLSMEPLTGAIKTGDKLRPCTTGEGPITWAILGGESGPRARPCDVDAVERLVLELRAAGAGGSPVATFVKQLGAVPMYSETVTDLGVQLSRLHRLPLLHRKGEDPAEWPDGLLVQEHPAGVYLPPPPESYLATVANLREHRSAS